MLDIHFDISVNKPFYKHLSHNIVVITLFVSGVKGMLIFFHREYASESLDISGQAMPARESTRHFDACSARCCGNHRQYTSLVSTTSLWNTGLSAKTADVMKIGISMQFHCSILRHVAFLMYFKNMSAFDRRHCAHKPVFQRVHLYPQMLMAPFCHGTYC